MTTVLPFLEPEHIASFFTLVFLEIVLAGDNLVLIAILSSRLPPEQRPVARRFGLAAAVITRLLLLFSLFWLSHLQTPIPLDQYGLKGFATTPRQIVLGLGGLFLLLKSLSEIASFFDETGERNQARSMKPGSSIFVLTIVQIAVFDIVFSLDSVIAAIGIARHVQVMAAAIVAAALVMLLLVNVISNFIDRHPTIKLIALNFLALVGIILVAEAFRIDIERAWYYLGLACVTVVQLVGYWFIHQTPLMRRVVLVAALALVAVMGIGAWQDTTGQASPFRDTYLAAVHAFEAARAWIESLLASMRPFFGVHSSGS
jgi:predicted tellurium resistance membrane protein TerC